ncbi:MAG: hypothetical protein ABIE03_07165, partial [Patescibacteria group bacterium]
NSYLHFLHLFFPLRTFQNSVPPHFIHFCLIIGIILSQSVALFIHYPYIHENPVVKGYVDKEEDWIYSSARNYYCDDHSVIKVVTG